MMFRRALSYGKLYLIIGTVFSFIIVGPTVASVHLAPSSANVSSKAVGSAVALAIPGLMLPLFGVMGSMGSLMVFVSDKDKGVYEYLIAYGVDVSRIFWSIVLASIGLASIVLVISVSATLAIMEVLGAPMTMNFLELLGFYVVPITFATTAFINMIGMIWSSLTKRMAGVNSPVGLAPIIGMAPIIAVFVSSVAIGPSYIIPFVSSVSVAFLVLVAMMIRVSNTRMVRERFLSNA